MSGYSYSFIPFDESNKFIEEAVTALRILEKNMTKYTFNTPIILVVLMILNGCVTQSFENDEPIVKTQANRDEMAATRVSLGLGYLKMGNMSQAKLNLEKAKRFSPQLVQVHTAFAHYYETVGEGDLAIESFEHALSIKADSPDTLNNYGVFLCRQDRVEEAEKQFLKAIAVPSYLLVAQSYENLSSCYLQDDNFEKAELYLNKAIHHSPNNTSILRQMVLLQYAMGDYTSAKRYLQKFERNTQRFTAQFLALAYKVYWKSGQRRTATKYGDMLVKMYPQSWEGKQYLLNGLNFIDADELARKYSLIQREKNKGKQPKNTKRVVKLSPNKSGVGSVITSSTVVATTNNANVNSETVTEGASVSSSESTTSNESQQTEVSVTEGNTKSASNKAVPSESGVASGVISTAAVATSAAASAASSTGSAAVATGAVVAGAVVSANVNDESAEVTVDANNQSNSAAGTSTPVEENLNATESGKLLNEDATPTTPVSPDGESISPEPTGTVVTTGVVATSVAGDVNTTDNLEDVDKATQVSTDEIETAVSTNENLIPEAASTATATEIVEDININENSPTSTQPVAAKRDVALPEALPPEPEPEPVVEVIEVAEVNSPTEEVTTHKVSSGENLYNISVKYNVRLSALRKWNDIPETNRIKIGQSIYIVDPETVKNIND